jgi:hypothetical protein
LDTAHYNQVAGKSIEALFEDGVMYRTNIDGNAQTYYYMVDEADGAMMGYLVAESSDMSFYIEDNTVYGIMYRGDPVYTIYPMDKIPETQPTKLPGFKWEASRRPTQDSVFTRVIEPSQRIERRALMRPLFPINAILQQRKADYIRRREWRDRTDTLSYETIEWLESIKSY